MTLQTTAPVYVPAPISNGEFTPSSATLDAAGEKIAYITYVPEDGTITHVTFRVAGLTTAQTLRVSLQTLDASGNPSGTLYGGSTAGTQASPTANTWYRVALGTGATAVGGDRIAIVVEWDATAGNLNVNTYLSPASFGPQPVYIAEFTTGAWVKTRTRLGMFALDYNGTYYPMIASPVVTGSEAYHDGLTNDERGNRFVLPFKARAIGAWFHGQIFSTAGSGDVKLYGETTESVSLAYASLASPSDYHTHYVYFANPVSLNASTTYRLALRATHATEYVGILVGTATDNATLGAFDWGINSYYTARGNDGAWTDTTNKVSIMGLILDQLSDDAGSGGLAIPVSGRIVA